MTTDDFDRMARNLRRQLRRRGINYKISCKSTEHKKPDKEKPCPER
jgi:tRNA A37 threonylcarbamoyladenosine dehydratase